MIVKIVFDNKESSIFQDSLQYEIYSKFPNIEIETYNEDYYKEKKKAIMIKASCGTRLTPFVAVYNDNKDLVKAFYSEVGDCTIENIIKYLKNEIQ